jgi:hypothetical protein
MFKNNIKHKVASSRNERTNVKKSHGQRAPAH